jgi:hypothetical protein
MRESSIFLFEHDLFGKPVPTFPDHAPMPRILIAKPDATFAEHTNQPANRRCRRSPVCHVQIGPVALAGKRQNAAADHVMLKGVSNFNAM